MTEMMIVTSLAYAAVGTTMLWVTVGTAFGKIHGWEMDEPEAGVIRDLVIDGGFSVWLALVMFALLWPFVVIKDIWKRLG